ncbi:MAG: hypothetical protein GDA54_02895 [Alphaproteobacteria bacterium GM7ARS4]|nr:hypothetical protein [Alphaproteobacteria bacterium GM7ARS4]
MFSSPLPDKSDASLQLMQWMIAAIVYAASILVALVLVVSHVVEHWRGQLGGHITIQVIPKENAHDRESIERLQTVIRQFEGVDNVSLVPQEELDAMLAPWLNARDTTEDKHTLPWHTTSVITIPLVIHVQKEKDMLVDLARLQETIETFATHVSVDDHNTWFAENFAFITQLQLVAFGIIGLLICVAMVVVTFMARIGVSLHYGTIEILCLIGARDHFISRIIARRFGIVSLQGGAFGSVFAVITLVLLGTAHAQGAFWFQDMSLWEKQLLWGGLSILPFLFASVVVMVTWMTTWRALIRML